MGYFLPDTDTSFLGNIYVIPKEPEITLYEDWNLPWSKVFATSQAKNNDLSLAIPSNPCITKVIYNNPATIVWWSDGIKTVVRCQPGDTYSPETGLAMAISKRVYGNDNRFNKVFARWLPHDEV